MTVPQDVKLYDFGWYYDFRLTDSGDIEGEDSFESSLIVSLLTDKRATATEVPRPQDRRGWIGNLGYAFEIGSKLWLYSQIRNTVIDIQKLKNEAIAATKHYVEDGLVKKITVDVEFNQDGPLLTINIYKFSNKVDPRYFQLWNNTGA